MRVKSGIVYGQQMKEVFAYCKETKCALPAVNIIGSSTANAAMHAAKQASSPIIIQYSHGGSIFNAGKNVDNTGNRAAIAGAIAGALHIHQLSKLCGVPVILHTDHCQRKIIDWVDGLIKASEEYYKVHNMPIYSSHMLDLSEEDLDANINTCAEHLQKMAKLDMTLEIELGVTGGEEDGVDNSDIDSSRLYTQPEDVLKAYDALQSIGQFTVAAAFGNTHGVYKPGNVKLTPEILKNSQNLVQQERNTGEKPLDLVFHGGSGSDKAKIVEAVSYGVVKMNIDTDTQWAYCRPVREYVDEHHDYLMAQIGNPEGDDKPNKKHIDPRGWLIKAENGVSDRLIEAFKDLNSFGKFTLED